jgi:hypothetical protein
VAPIREALVSLVTATLDSVIPSRECPEIGGVDRSRIRTNPGVFARLRSFAFNILKANRTDTLSQDRYRAGLAGVKRLLRMLAIP